jgi:hypothetical protein
LQVKGISDVQYAPILPIQKRLTSATAVAMLTLAWPAAAETRYFEHRDDRYLYHAQNRGGAALLPEAASPDSPVPLVVFLHGTSSSGELHLWLGGGSRDLRPLATRLMRAGGVQPFVLAGPSQTKRASLARSLWSGFDLELFVEDVVQATRDAVQIDRARVLFMGHSGAGCNPTGGLSTDFWTNGHISPFAVVSIDTCLDEEMGGAFARRPAAVPLSVWWQPALWARAPNEFWSALQQNKPAGRVDIMTKVSVTGANPHDAIVPLAFERTLRELLSLDTQPVEDSTSVPK